LSIIIIISGYGHIFPVTEPGMLFCILYALIGIPLLLVWMTDVSELMSAGVTYTYRLVKESIEICYIVPDFRGAHTPINPWTEQIQPWFDPSFFLLFVSRICCRWCRVRRRDAELPPDADRKQMSIMTDHVGKETYMPTENIQV
jgi:hypothetical protein